MDDPSSINPQRTGLSGTRQAVRHEISRPKTFANSFLRFYVLGKVQNFQGRGPLWPPRPLRVNCFADNHNLINSLKYCILLVINATNEVSKTNMEEEMGMVEFVEVLLS